MITSLVVVFPLSVTPCRVLLDPNAAKEADTSGNPVMFRLEADITRLVLLPLSVISCSVKLYAADAVADTRVNSLARLAEVSYNSAKEADTSGKPVMFKLEADITSVVLLPLSVTCCKVRLVILPLSSANEADTEPHWSIVMSLESIDPDTTTEPVNSWRSSAVSPNLVEPEEYTIEAETNVV